jgi:hypothetical protein
VIDQLLEDIRLSREMAGRQFGCSEPGCLCCVNNRERTAALERLIERCFRTAERCSCGVQLTFAENPDGSSTCWCSRCKLKAERGDGDGHTIFFYGNGSTRARALRDWYEALKRF